MIFKLSRRNQVNKTKLLATVFIGAFAATGALADDDQSATSSIGTIQVQGVGADAASQPGAGLMIPEESSKAKSTVTKAFIATQRPSENFYQSLALLPGVNQHQDDAFGLSGGTIKVRGLNSAEIGFTLEGVPLNDASSYAVFPNEYIVAQDTQEVYITQGSTDISAPHTGASGGNVVITAITPSDQAGGYAEQSFGQDRYSQTFFRVESGLLETGTKFFVSGGTAYAHQWNAPGDDEFQHTDFKLVQKIGEQSDFQVFASYHREQDNFYDNSNLASFEQNGFKGTVFNSNFTPGDTNFYKLRLNPFEDLVSSATAHLQLTDNLRLIATPYFWYGFGNGGGAISATQGGSITESPPGLNGKSTIFASPTETLNIPGVTKGSIVTLYDPSNTLTYRPGIQSTLEYKISNFTLQGGLWYENSHQSQTGPFSVVNANGNFADPFGTTNELVDQLNGSTLEKRHSITHDIVIQEFGEIDSSWLNDSLKVSIAVRHPDLERDVNNLQVGTPAQFGFIKVDNNFLLPQFGVTYEFAPNHSLFADYTQNAKLPANFQQTDSAITAEQLPEKTQVYEIGYRYQTSKILATIDYYNVQLQNFEAEAIIPGTNDFTDTNIGGIHTQGFESQVGYQASRDISTVAAATYTESIFQNSFLDGSAASPNELLPIAGKTNTDTPKWILSAGLEYADNSRQLAVDGGFFGGIEAQYQSKRFSSEVNDESVDANYYINAHVGYHFGSWKWLQDPLIQVNATNLTDHHYLNEISQNTNAHPVVTSGGTIAASAPSYLAAAPRTFSVTLSTKF
jgi:iron complex outermembrane receptor protein